MRKIRLTKFGKYSICIVAFISLIGTLALVDNSLNKKEQSNIDQDYVGKVVITDDIPVINSTNYIIRPYLDNNVKILKKFYDYKGSEEDQINSIIYYESTYMPNYTVAYGGIDNFEVVSILDGTVESVKNDEILGNIIEIKHQNDLISVYQSVDNVTVKDGQIIKQGEVIASSGKSNLNNNLDKHLLFELLYKGQIVNPEEFYNKDINQL